MTVYILPLVFVLLVAIAMIVMNERVGLLGDRFNSTGAKVFAYVWLTAFLVLVALLIVASSIAPPSPKELAKVPFYSLFSLHAILTLFLAGWWLAAARPPIREFLNIRRDHVGEAVLTGTAVGLSGWMFTIAAAMTVALILQASGLMPKAPQPPAMIAWMAGLAFWKKILIVLSAMTIEEAFFRGWLQKRVGVIASTILFALAHSGMGQPFLLIGVFFISLVIGLTFYRTKNLIPGVIAHGVFDAVQLFVIIPIAFRMTGLGL